MFFFKKKKEEEVESEEPEESQENNSNISFGQAVADLEKLKAQFSTFYEMQKAVTERFTRINEQVGELRSMLIERDKESKYIEAKATQAIDLVKTVQPDRLMIELRKGDGKIEALRANLESNENIIHNTINELKEMRLKISTFRGMEQVVKLNDEVKSEIMEIKKISALVERHADKVETIFSEMQKKFSAFEKYSSITDDLDKAAKQIGADVDSIKIKMADLSNKKSVENLLSKFDDFEKHTGNVVSLMNSRFDNMKKELYSKFEERFEKTDKLLRGFEALAEKTPDLDKYFNLLSEEAKKAPQKDVKVEKIKAPGEEQQETIQKKGIFGKVKEKLGK